MVGPGLRTIGQTDTRLPETQDSGLVWRQTVAAYTRAVSAASSIYPKQHN